LSTDNGDNWSIVGNNDSTLHCYDILILDCNIYAATYDGLYLLTDNGTKWTCVGLKDCWVLTFYLYGNNIFAGSSCGTYLSTDKGNSWMLTNTGSGSYCDGVESFIVNGVYVFALTNQSGIFRAKLSDFGITNIDVKEDNQYNETIIYPNPASSSVRVKYESASISKLQISIFDLLGNELFNTSEACNIGMNEKTIDCRSLETGYYVVRLKQGERVSVKPLVLLK